MDNLPHQFNPKPCENYEGLLKQFRSTVTIIRSMEKARSYYMQKDYTLSQKRLDELEAALESEREMSAILTEELQKEQTND